MGAQVNAVEGFWFPEDERALLRFGCVMDFASNHWIYPPKPQECGAAIVGGGSGNVVIRWSGEKGVGRTLEEALENVQRGLEVQSDAHAASARRAAFLSGWSKRKAPVNESAEGWSTEDREMLQTLGFVWAGVREQWLYAARPFDRDGARLWGRSGNVSIRWYQEVAGAETLEDTFARIDEKLGLKASQFHNEAREAALLRGWLRGLFR